ncbi:MAG: hypothetical protein B7X48_10410 [Acidiphilium sp. 34-60-192]|nr:MAG: hypothetical protein B7X48_10410 [Acidiphilium sp. 34-60-192]
MHKHVHMDATPIAPVYLLHIPKTAGTSLRAALSDYYRDRLCPAAMWDDFFRDPTLRTTPYAAYCGHFGIELAAYLGCPLRVVTILRDPLARTISHFNEVRRTTTHPLHPHVIGQTLFDFVHDPTTVPMVANFQARYLTQAKAPIERLATLFEPNWNNAYSLSVAWENASTATDPDHLHRMATANLRTLDAIFTTERLETEAATLQQALGLPPALVPRRNVTQGPAIPIDPRTRARIAGLTRVDQALYDAAKAML